MCLQEVAEDPQMGDEAEANARTTPVPEERPRYAFDEGDSAGSERSAARLQAESMQNEFRKVEKRKVEK